MNIGDLWLALRGDGTMLQKDVVKAGDQAGKTFGQKFGAQLGQSATRLAVTGGAAVGAFVAGSTQAFARFDDSMREVFAIMPGISAEAMGKMKKDVLDVSKQYGILTDDLVPALATAIGSGIPEQNVMSFLETAAKAAKAGATDAETSVKVLSATLNAFHLPVESANDVADKFFNAIDKGVTTFPELADSMSRVAPQAEAMGISLEEVLAAVTAMTLQGTPTSEAVTDIAASITALNRRTPEMQAALKAIGFETGQAAINALGYQGTLEALRTQAGLTGTELIELTGRGEGAAAMFQLTGDNAGKANEILRTFDNTTGKVEAAFQTMEGGIGGVSRKIVANLQAIAIEMGDSLQIIGPLFVAFGPTVGRLLGSAIGAGAGLAMRFAGPAIARLAAAVMEKFGIEIASAGAGKAVAGAIEAMPSGPAGVAAKLAGTRLGALMGAGISAGIIAAGAAAIYFVQSETTKALEKTVSDEFGKVIEKATNEQLATMRAKLAADVASPIGQIGGAASGLFGGKGAQQELDQLDAAIAARAASVEGTVGGMVDHVVGDLKDPAIGNAAEGAGADIESGLGDGAKDAAATVETAAGKILSAILGLRGDVGSAASAAADAIFDPFLKGQAAAQTKRDIAEQRRIIGDKDSTKKQIREAKVRRAELQKQLFVQLTDLTTYGTDAQRIAAIKAALASDAVADAYRDGTPEQRAAIDEWRRVLNGQMTTIQGNAATGGAKTGDAYASGLSGSKGDISGAGKTAVSGVDNAMKLAPQARTWGDNLGDAWIRGVAAAIRAGRETLYGAVLFASAGLHGHSPPKVGPLRHIDEWGENVALAWAGGMLSAAGEVKRSANMLATAALPHVNPLTIGGAPARATPAVPGLMGAASVANKGDVYNINVPVQGLIRARDPLEVAGQLRRLADLGALSPKKPAYR